MGKGGSAPSPPSPTKTAAAEFRYNNSNVYTPSGAGVVYGHTDPDTGEFVAAPPGKGQQSAVYNIESPTQQAIRERLEPAAIDFTGSFIDQNIDNLPDAARVQDRSDVAEDIFKRNFSLMAPAIEKSQDKLITNLQARGMPVGSSAWNDAYGNQLTETQATIARLAQDANIAAGQEQTRQFGLDQAERQGAMAEIAALMGGNYQPPINMAATGAANIDYSGLVNNQYNQQLQAYNQSQQQKMQTASALGSLGSALIKSSAAVKTVSDSVPEDWAEDIVRELPVYAWAYRDGQDRETHIGPMAQDFQRLTGLGTPENISVIDYFGLLTAALRDAYRKIDSLYEDLSELQDDVFNMQEAATDRQFHGRTLH
ncbi:MULTISPECIES: tail fiber domain-containing protein [unclassified Mameliella]|uniref:tail fiber domain-containing protein n=1 Tax=unclassified Mameliella TaxID=2630630 RepID=UPI00274007DF|nr:MULTISPECIES: tail fiber domain-containing protein [unclassified Mameliella]